MLDDDTISYINSLYRIEAALVQIRKNLKQKKIGYDGTLSTAIHGVLRASTLLSKLSDEEFKKTEIGKKIIENIRGNNDI